MLGGCSASSADCSIEVALFGSQLIRLGTMKKEEFAAHSNLVVFYIILYIRLWTQSPLLVDSAVNDLALLKELKKMHYPPFDVFKQAVSATLEFHLGIIFILQWFIVYYYHNIVSLKISPENGNFGARLPWKHMKMCFLRFLSKVIILDPKYVHKFNINMLIPHLLSLISPL